MDILFLVDLHWTEKRPLELPPMDGVDLVLLGGDLTNFRGAETAAVIVDEIRSRGPRVLAVCGNCDLPEMESYMRAEEIDLDRRCRSIDDVDFLGISAGLPFGDLPYERDETQFGIVAEEAFAAGRDDAAVTVLVSHQPPHGTRCDLTREAHVGSRAIRSSILEHQPDLVLSGHIHEAIASDHLGASRLVNPGPWFAGHQYRFSIGDGLLEAPDVVA